MAKAKVKLSEDGKLIIPPSSEMYEAAKAVRVRALAGMKWWRARMRTCPLCASSGFEIDAKKNTWRCSACGGKRKHGPIGYVMRRDLVGRDEAVRSLASLEPMPEHISRLRFSAFALKWKKRLARRFFKGLTRYG